MGFQFPSTNPNQLPTPTDNPHDDVPSPFPLEYANHSTSWTPIESVTPISTNPSRKRSRDETAFEQDLDGSYFPSQQVNTPAPIPEEEPIYGEGMMLLNPRTGMAVSAESQTGTWYEEEAEELANQPPPVIQEFRPRLPSSRKSMRLSQSSIRPFADLDPIMTANSNLTAPASPPKTASNAPEIDEATLALGIGWARVASDEDVDMQAAARGWARYLENHYARHIHQADILLKSTGLNAYLVVCNEGFFLFSEDLLEGKLVGRTWQTCLVNLRVQPMAFEGEEVLRAERTPGPEESYGAASANGSSSVVVEKMENYADYARLHGVSDAVQNGVAGDNGEMEID